MGLLSKISGRIGEDIATEVLAYLLSIENANVPFQKLFFLRVLGNTKTSLDLEAEVATQTSFAVGRPDCVVRTKTLLL